MSVVVAAIALIWVTSTLGSLGSEPAPSPEPTVVETRPPGREVTFAWEASPKPSPHQIIFAKWSVGDMPEPDSEDVAGMEKWARSERTLTPALAWLEVDAPEDIEVECMILVDGEERTRSRSRPLPGSGLQFCLVEMMIGP